MVSMPFPNIGFSNLNLNNYYRESEMSEGDNPPVGLILCT